MKKTSKHINKDKIKVRNLDDNSVRTWTISEILDRINEDNASDDFNYNENDWIEGFVETLGEFYSLLDKDNKPLNNLSKYIGSNKKII